jgi:hypothetical protein
MGWLRFRSDIELAMRDRGAALVRLRIGDADGTGRPALQIELAHPFLPRPAAVAMSRDEAERLAHAITVQCARLRRLEVMG